MFAIFALMVVFIPAIVIVAAVAYMKFKKNSKFLQLLVGLVNCSITVEHWIPFCNRACATTKITEDL